MPTSVPETPDVEMTVDVSEAKGRLSELVARVEHGGRVTLARGGHPVVDLVPHRGAPRVLGLLRHIVSDFDEAEFVRQIDALGVEDDFEELDAELEGL